MEGTIGPSAANQMAVAKMPIEQVEDANRELAAVRPIIPQGVPSAEKKTFLNALQTAFQDTVNISRDNQGEITEMKNDVSQEPELAMASSYFDLTKISQQMTAMPTDMGMPAEQPMADDSMGAEVSDEETGLSFNTPQELQQILDSNAQNPDFVNQLLEMTPAESQPMVRDSIQRYYEPGKDEADKTILSAEIFKAIHGRGQGEDQVSAEYIQASVEKSISEANKLIEQFAKKAASCKVIKKEASSFNLKKQAQAYAGSLHSEFLNFGPNSIRMLPHSNTGVIGSDWHVWIRAKDHGFIMDDHAVDFETFWRGNIMDKYSQPYRNDKGEWVGGYLNKRFETDRNVPEGNNHQLLPGQRRRPYMPEFATMEARLEDSRGKFARERGYDPTDSDAKAYNWKEASSVKKK